MDKLDLIYWTLKVLCDETRWSQSRYYCTMQRELMTQTNMFSSALHGKEVIIDDPYTIGFKHTRGIIRSITFKMTYIPYFDVQLPDHTNKSYISSRLTLK